MPISTVEQSPKASDSDFDPEELDDDEEYEEVEIEEEIEVEVEEEVSDDEEQVAAEEVEEEKEEVEEEEIEAEEKEEEFGEDLSPINEDQCGEGYVLEGWLVSVRNAQGIRSWLRGESLPFVNDASSDQQLTLKKIKRKRKRDDSKVMESTGLEENPTSCSSYQGNSVANLQRDKHVVEENRGNAEASDGSGTRLHEEFHVNGKRSHMDDDTKAPVCNSDPSNPFNVSGEGVNTAVSVADSFNEETDIIVYPKEEHKRKYVQSGDDINQMEPRLDASVRPSGLSPGLEIKEGNKRPAIVCDFFAKGWCIKGNSCRFLHIRDHKDSSQVKEGSVASAKGISEMQADEGLREGAGRSGFTGVTDEATSERIPPWDKGEIPRWNSESGELHLNKDNHGTIFPPKDVGKESLRQNWYLGNNSSSISTSISRPGMFSSSSARSSDIYGGDKVSSFATSTFQLTTGVLPSSYSSAWTRSSLSFSSSSWSTDPLGTLRHLDGDREFQGSRSALLQRSSSSLSGSESESLSKTYISRDPLLSAGYKTKFSSSDWEPSIPFRPSYFITQSLLSRGSQYDPLRDSIDQTNLGEKLSRFSSSSQGTPISRTHLPRNANPVSAETFCHDYSCDKHSQASPQNFLDSDVDKNSYGNELVKSKILTVGTDVAEQDNKNILTKEDKLLPPAHGRDITRASEVRAEHGFLLQKEGTRFKDMKVDGASQNNEVDFDADGIIQQESKALKNFRAALIDFVKELVKPTWRMGNLSKDAHKVIVKKSVEKVLNAIPPHEIPNTPETVEMYLTLSQPKIAKLVEVYVDKYGKL